MSDVDHSLLYEARKLLNGANVHLLGSAILCYETSPENSAQRTIFETGLPQLVYEHRKHENLLLRAQIACKASESIRTASDALRKEMASIRKPKGRRM
jgi:hypothetical protein